MALPTGWSLVTRDPRIQRDAVGNIAAVAIDYTTYGSGGQVTGGGTHTIPANAPGTGCQFCGDGATTAFATSAAGCRVQQVRVSDTVEATGFVAAQNADKTWTVTFRAAPAAATKDANNQPIPNVFVLVQTGPGLDDPACDLGGTLGLSQGSGTVYSGDSQTAAHATLDGHSGVTLAWASARLLADIFG